MTIIWLFAAAGLAVFIYLLPLAICWHHGRTDLVWLMILLNVVLGWTIVGWLAALAIALTFPIPSPSTTLFFKEIKEPHAYRYRSQAPALAPAWRHVYQRRRQQVELGVLKSLVLGRRRR